jgi:hypothetical protein
VERSVLRLSLAAACLALVAGSIVVSFWVATRNFEIANFEKTPKARAVLASIEGDEARTMAARWFASESNRALFGLLNPLQVAGTAAAALLGLRALRGRAHEKLARRLLVVALALAIALAPLVPMMIAKGRAIDFVSRAGGTPPEVRDFMMWHGLYSAADVLLLASALVLIPLLSLAASSPRPGATP